MTGAHLLYIAGAVFVILVSMIFAFADESGGRLGKRSTKLRDR